MNRAGNQPDAIDARAAGVAAAEARRNRPQSSDVELASQSPAEGTPLQRFGVASAVEGSSLAERPDLRT